MAAATNRRLARLDARRPLRRLPGPARASVQAATLGAAAATAGLELGEHVVAAINGDRIARDPEMPLAAGDEVALLAADAGG